MLNPTHIYTVKKGCENRIFGFPQKYHVKTTQDTTQVTFRVFQAKLGPVNFQAADRQAASRFYVDDE